MNSFENIFKSNYPNLVDGCKSFAANLVGTKYEFLLDYINPSLLNPNDIQMEECYDVIEALFNAPHSGNPMAKIDSNGYLNHNLMFFNPLNNALSYLSFNDNQHLKQIRRTRLLYFMNNFIKNELIDIEKMHLSDITHFENERRNQANTANHNGIKYSVLTVTNFIKDVMGRTFGAEYYFDDVNSTKMKTIFKKKINESYYLGLQFDLTPFKLNYSIYGELRLPTQVDLFFTKTEHKISTENTIFLGEYANPCHYIYNLSVFQSIMTELRYENKKIIQNIETKIHSNTSDLSINSQHTFEDANNVFPQWDMIMKCYIHVYFNLLKFSAQPYENYVVDCIKKIE